MSRKGRYAARVSLRLANLPGSHLLNLRDAVDLGVHAALPRDSWIPGSAESQSSHRSMRIQLVNPSDSSFGIGVITPRWLYVLAAATPASYGDPLITDETLEQIQPERIQPGDIVGIGIHTGNALRGMEVGRMARERGALVVYGGIHATLYPEEAKELGGAHVVVKGDGDVI